MPANTKLGFQIGAQIGAAEGGTPDVADGSESLVGGFAVGDSIVGAAPAEDVTARVADSAEEIEIDPTAVARVPQTSIQVEIDRTFGSGTVRDVLSTEELEIDVTDPLARVAHSTEYLELVNPTITARAALSVELIEIDQPIPARPGIRVKFIEPDAGLRDRTDFVKNDSPPNFSRTMGQRGTATITLTIEFGNSLQPARGWPVSIYQTIDAVEYRLFAGTIDTVDKRWDDAQVGFIDWTLTCIDLEAALDTIRLTPQSFENQSARQIIGSIFEQFPALPIAIGDVQDGVFVTSRPVIYDRASDLIQELSDQSGYIKGIDPSTSVPSLYFREPAIVPAPYEFVSEMLLWLTAQEKQTRTDFRDRQITKISWNAFAPSVELFPGNDTQTVFNLRAPVDHVVSVALTTATQSAVTGTFTGQPNPGDTITVGQYTYTFVAVLDNTQFGQVLIRATFDLTAQGFADALDATISGGGTEFSLPTWENFWASATVTAPGVLIVRSKATGDAGKALRYSENAANFAWTSGGGGSGGAGAGSLDNPLLTAYGTFTNLNPALGGTVLATLTAPYTSGDSQILVTQTGGFTGSEFFVQIAPEGANAVEVINVRVVDTNTYNVLATGQLGTVAGNHGSGATITGYVEILDGDTITLNGRTYTFKFTLNNATPDQIHIDPTTRLVPISFQMQAVSQTTYNVIDAINVNPATAGTNYSSATSANTDYQCATTPASGSLNINTKLFSIQIALYALTTASPTLSSSSGTPARFAWELVTASGSADNGSTTPTNAGTPVQDGDVIWSPGSSSITLKTPPPTGQSVLVTYYRLGSNCIAAEDSTLVASRAAIETGTGRYDQMSDDSGNVDPWNALLKLQATLQQFGTLPREFQFQTYKPSLNIGDQLSVNLLRPTGASSLNGSWLVQAMKGDALMRPDDADAPFPTLTPDRGSKFKFTYTVISTTQLATYIKFWALLAQVGSAQTGSAGGGSVAGSSGSTGGSSSSGVSGTPGDLPVFAINTLTDSGVSLDLLITAIGGLPRPAPWVVVTVPTIAFIG